MSAKRGCGRPVGARVRQVVAIVEAAGRPMTYTEVGPSIPEVPELCNVHKYLRRAVDYGLMERRPGSPQRFAAVDNWRAMLDVPVIAKTPRSREKRKPKLPVSSVWELGSRALQSVNTLKAGI